MYVVDVDAVDTVGQSFAVNFFMAFQWRDPRHAHAGPAPIVAPLTQVWSPQIQLLNRQKVLPTFPEVVEISADGTAVYRQRVWGNFAQPLDLHDFPFDRQEFNIQLIAAGFQEGGIELVSDGGKMTGMARMLTVPDWTVVGWEAEPRMFEPIPGLEIPGFAFSFQAQRRRSYYVIKVIVPLVLIVMMSWVAFFTDPQESGTAIAVATTSMLTLIAYRFAIGHFLPVVSYLTRLDYFILAATILVFGTLVEVAITRQLVRSGRNERAASLDRLSRFLFPALFIYVTAHAFFLPLPGS